MSVKVAVVGAGYLGRHHARVYSELEDAELVGVVDVDRDRAGGVAGEYGSKPFSDYREVLDDADAVSIVVPTTLHYDVALDCLRAGKDVLVEKPMTVTIEQADELINEAERRGRILQVGHLERYNPGVIALSHMVKAPRFVEAVRVSPFLNRGIDVEVTLDLMIHDIDVVLSLVPSPVERIQASGFSFLTKRIDDARAWIEFGNGTMALLTASRMAKEKERKLRVFEEGSYLELDYQQTEIRRYSRPGARGGEGNGKLQACGVRLQVTSEKGPEHIVETIKPEYAEPLMKELKDFISCVTDRRRPKVSGLEGMDALRVALEINSLIGSAR